MDELISVIIPVYNIKESVTRCIVSVLGQSYEKIEIILVDDGSTDGSGEICDKYKKQDGRIRIIHKVNGGLSDARNKGIECAKGKYITLIDGDDYVESNYVVELYRLLKKYDADMSITSHEVVYPNKKIKKWGLVEFVDGPEGILDRILYNDKVDLSAWGKLYKRELFDGIRYPKGRLFEDSATTYKLVDKCAKIAVKTIPTYNYVMRNESIVNQSFSDKKFDLVTSTKEMTSYIGRKYPLLISGCKRRLMYAYLSTLSQLAKSTTKNKQSENRLMSYIKRNRKDLLKDRRLPKRDRVALLSTYFGFWFFRLSWRIYERISGRA